MTIPELQDLEQRYVRATRVSQAPEITALLVHLSIHFWQPGRPEGHWEAVISDFVKHLTPYPIDIISEACDRWHDPEHATGFFPKIHEIKAIIMPLNAKRLRDLQDVRAFLHQRIQASEHDRAPPTPDDTADVAAMVAEAKRNLAGGSDPKPIGQAAADVLKDFKTPAELSDSGKVSDASEPVSQNAAPTEESKSR